MKKHLWAICAAVLMAAGLILRFAFGVHYPAYALGAVSAALVLWLVNAGFKAKPLEERKAEMTMAPDAVSYVETAEPSVQVKPEETQNTPVPSASPEVSATSAPEEGQQTEDTSEQAQKNARLNGVEDRVSFLCRDVFALLPELIEKGEQYDVVILDPPAFTKSRNSIKAAARGYREINLRGMKLVRNGGYLATCSCSHFMDPELFKKTIGEAARDAHRRLRQVEFRTQAPDHPILWSSDESYYLKFYIFQVVEE